MQPLSLQLKEGMPEFPAPPIDVQLSMAMRQVAHLERCRWVDRRGDFGYRRRLHVAAGLVDGVETVVLTIGAPSDEGEYGVEGPTVKQIVEMFDRSGWIVDPLTDGVGRFSMLPGRKAVLR